MATALAPATCVRVRLVGVVSDAEPDAVPQSATLGYTVNNTPNLMPFLSRRRLGKALQHAAVRCETVLCRAFRARRVRTSGIGGEVRHGVTSGVSCETSLNKRVTPHLHREYRPRVDGPKASGVFCCCS